MFNNMNTTIIKKYYVPNTAINYKNQKMVGKNNTIKIYIKNNYNN